MNFVQYGTDYKTKARIRMSVPNFLSSFSEILGRFDNFV